MNTQDVDKYLQQLHNEGLAKGLKKGREEGLGKGLKKGFGQAVMAAYQARFGAPPVDLVAAVERARDQAELERWLQIVITRSADEVIAALRRPRAASSGRRTGAGARRSGSSQQRTSASK